MLNAFPPLASNGARVLILGSMPGIASLAIRQYYAHPQNAFWRILITHLGLNAGASYESRVRSLLDARLALWDVLCSCERAGSADSAIVRATEVANDFDTFFHAYPHIRHVFFNGSAAESLFKRHCATLYKDSRFTFVRLPSTSPANAGITFDTKSALWRAALLASE